MDKIIEDSITLLKSIRNYEGDELKIIKIEAWEMMDKDIIIRVNNSIIQMEAEGCIDFIIIIYNTRIDINKLLKQLKSTYFSKVFLYKELIVCPIRNSLVPKHELSSKKEVTEKFRIQRFSTLPKINMKDIISRWYGWEHGSIIKIYRSDETIYYRIVVE